MNMGVFVLHSKCIFVCYRLPCECAYICVHVFQECSCVVHVGGSASVEAVSIEPCTGMYKHRHIANVCGIRRVCVYENVTARVLSTIDGPSRTPSDDIFVHITSIFFSCFRCLNVLRTHSRFRSDPQVNL